MPTNTYVALDKVTVGTATPSVTFSSISGNYTDLRIVVQTAVNTETYMRFNADTGSNYSGTEIWGSTSVTSERASNVTFITLRNSSSTLGSNMSTVDVMNYSNSTTNKTVLVATRDGLYSRVYRRVGLWRNTAAITSITFVPDAGNFPVGSTFSLYGIAASSVGAKATGGVVYSDDTHIYHLFTSTGPFTPSQSLSCDYLVVAGGGGGGGSQAGGYLGGGGGGAGGYRTSIGGSALSLSATTYTVTVGGGGAGGSGNRGSQGNNSVLDSITSTGGGYGGAQDATPIGGNGGSGGGGSEYSGTAAGGTGTSGQGFAGGSSAAQAGGGGGAGAVGTNGVNATATIGAGGIGSNSALTWATVTATGISGYYAGGGGGGRYDSGAGGAGGLGGGANGGVSLVNGDSGVVNTGGGGGGSGGSAGANRTGGTGGSGIVIVRYAK